MAEQPDVDKTSLSLSSRLRSVSFPATLSIAAAVSSLSEVAPLKATPTKLKLDTSQKVTLGIFPGTTAIEISSVISTRASDEADNESVTSTHSPQPSSQGSIRPNYGLTASSIPSPGAITFAEFKQRDLNPRHQRISLYQIYSSSHLKGCNDSKGSAPIRKKGTWMTQDYACAATNAPSISLLQFPNPNLVDSLKKDSRNSVVSQTKVTNAFLKLNNMLKPKKKKRTLSGTFHLLNMAIHDNRTSAACQLLEDLSPSQLRKKRPKETNYCFLHAMANGLESVCLILYDKGFPSNINAPAISTTHIISLPEAGVKSPPPREAFIFPSYFMMVVGIGLDNVVRAMVKRANVNQTWYGLTPLHLASCKGNQSVVRSLLENGADFKPGLCLETYYLFMALKSDAAKAVTASIALPPYRPQHRIRLDSTGSKKGVSRESTDLPIEFAAKRKIYPVELACAGRHLQTMKYLLSRYDSKTIQQLTFCFFARQNLESACAFLRAGVLPESQIDPWGSNAYHLAARNGDLGLVIAFTTHCKIDINSKGQNGWTALHESISQRHKDICQYLVKIGADCCIVNSDSETALALGQQIGLSKEELAEYFTSPVEIEMTELVKRYTSSTSTELKSSALDSKTPTQKRRKGGAHSFESKLPVESVQGSAEAGNAATAASSSDSNKFHMYRLSGKSSSESGFFKTLMHYKD